MEKYKIIKNIATYQSNQVRQDIVSLIQMNLKKFEETKNEEWKNLADTYFSFLEKQSYKNELLTSTFYYQEKYLPETDPCMLFLEVQEIDKSINI